MFIDHAKIFVRSGKGGDGAVMWRREKYVAAGGPAGGDGGRGGSVFLVATEDLNTLLDFRFNRKFIAPEGEKGGPKDMHGKDGLDVEVRVPVGTVVKDAPSGAILADLHEPGARFLAAKGGRGGRGNARFATPTRKAPQFAEPGGHAEEHELALELKLLADVGLVGLPNAGKSSLIGAVSAARPKVADYPFTTLEPHLGVIHYAPGDNVVMADIPGLVEGASSGVGLGHEFLRHVERCRVLVHLLDLSGGFEGRDPLEDFRVINAELQRYSPELAARPMLVWLNKTDLAEARAQLERVEKTLRQEGFTCFAGSAATREGLEPFLNELHRLVRTLPPPVIFTPTPVPKVEEVEEPVRITREKDRWLVTHAKLERLISHLNPESAEAMVRFSKLLDEYGVVTQLREMGVQDGDDVSIGDFDFEFID